VIPEGHMEEPPKPN